MSNPVPSSLALVNIAPGANILSADHRTNYAAIQAAANALIAALSGGVAGQALLAAGASSVVWGAAGAMTLIDDYTVTGAVLASYDTNTRLGGVLPTGYKHLRLVYTGRGDTAALNADVLLRFNNDSAANYDYTYMSHTAAVAGNSSAGTAVTAGRAGQITAATGTAGRVGSAVLELLDYNGVVFDKEAHGTWTCIYDTAGNQMIGYHMTHWRSAAAITRLAVLPIAGNFAIGSRFSLYGIS